MKKKGRVIILSGPSGAGKTTLHDLILKFPKFQGKIIKSVSATTRKPRGQERQGREYLFLSQKMFQHKIRAGHFLEWAKVFDNFYGTPLKNVHEALKAGRNVLLCIDVQGAKLVQEKVPGALTIFVKTPTLDELRQRLTGRGTDARESVLLRLKVAQKELKEAKKYSYVIVNGELKKAAAELEEILEKEI